MPLRPVYIRAKMLLLLLLRSRLDDAGMQSKEEEEHCNTIMRAIKRHTTTMAMTIALIFVKICAMLGLELICLCPDRVKGCFSVQCLQSVRARSICIQLQQTYLV